MSKNLTVIVLTVLFSILFLSVDGLSQEWSNEVYLTKGLNPDLHVDPLTGKVHVIGVMEGKGAIYIKTDKSGVKLDSLIVPNSGFEQGRFKFGPTIAVDSKGYAHVGLRQERGVNNNYDIFYTHQTEDNWTTPKKIGNYVLRGYVTRIAVDGEDRIHFAYGSMDPTWPNITGPVHYYLIKDDQILKEQHKIVQIRADERFELDASSDGYVGLVTSDLHYPPDPPDGGPIYYWYSVEPGDTLGYIGDIRDIALTRKGMNGSADLFIDQSGNNHICFGVQKDASIGNKMSVRYVRMKNGVKIRDSRVTDENEIWQNGTLALGVASVAASEDGEKVVVAYMQYVDGPLFARLSEDGGQTWGGPVKIADGWSSYDGRNKQIVRAYRSRFYLVYPKIDGKLQMKILDLMPNEPPVASFAVPDSVAEGELANFDASASEDPDGTIVSYMWDFEGDGVFDDTTTSPFNSHVYDDDFNGEVTLRVVDDQAEDDSVSVPITVFNVPPSADAGGPYVAQWYTPVQLQGSATDPGVLDILIYEWDLDGDNIFETIGEVVQSPQYASGDSHWVVLRVSDDDLGIDVDSALIVIDNQPPVVGNIFDQMINQGESFSAISLDAFVNDPDNPDSTLEWTIIGAINLSVIINEQRIASIVPLSEDWVGSETITFLVTDPGGKSASDTATFTVNDLNDPPVITEIPDQARLENEKFDDIQLDIYVDDPDDDDTSLSWSCVGAENFMVTITDHIATIAVVDSEWAGIDTVSFIVSDPKGLKDSADVTLTVYPINDWPVLSPIEHQSIFVGETFDPIFLDQYVFDPDDPDSLISWTWFGNSMLNIQMLPGRVLNLSPIDSSWTGTEVIMFRATDPKGLRVETTAMFTVNIATSLTEAEIGMIPEDYGLSQNYPNPFNPYTSIRYDIIKSTHVTLKIYNQLGHEVKTLIDEFQSAGSHHVIWDAHDNYGNRVSSGMYVYRIEADHFIRSKKMVLIY
ncbi:T9SS type A sorting domain-containing protein [candidate division KSB1 bacterium]|nr:T9SS type A sorting domain-containing protein [candidate division KSB1 bacterium]